jgi:hypothetical protein
MTGIKTWDVRGSEVPRTEKEMEKQNQTGNRFHFN